MTTSKVAMTIPSRLLGEAKKRVKRGEAKSLSAFVSEALDEKLRGDELGRVLDQMDEEYGSPSPGDLRWARRVLRR